MPSKVSGQSPERWGSGEWRGGGAEAYLSQEGGAHSKQLMHWRVRAPQLALMMQSGREEEGPAVLVESANTYGTHSLGHGGPFGHMDAHTHTKVCVGTNALYIWLRIRG